MRYNIYFSSLPFRQGCRENLDLCLSRDSEKHHFFAEECRSLSNSIDVWGRHWLETKGQCEGDIVRTEFSSGGELIHRGYYCPSPIRDIVVRNISRGKLLKQLTKRSRPSYRYCYNASDELIMVDILHNNTPKSSELIARQKQTEISFACAEDFGIQFVSSCAFENDKIISYVFATVLSDDTASGNISSHLVREDYTYTTEGLQTVDMYEFLDSTNSPLFFHNRYGFQHDAEGYLSGYTYAELAQGIQTKSVWDGHVFKIKTKRKI